MEVIVIGFLHIVVMSVGIYLAVRLALQASVAEFMNALYQKKNEDNNE